MYQIPIVSPIYLYNHFCSLSFGLRWWTSSFLLPYPSRALTLRIYLPLSATECVPRASPRPTAGPTPHPPVITVTHSIQSVLILLCLLIFAAQYMIYYVSLSSATTMQKVYMARFWLPLYTAVVMSMYAYDTLLTKIALDACAAARCTGPAHPLPDLSVRPHSPPPPPLWSPDTTPSLRPHHHYPLTKPLLIAYMAPVRFALV